MAHPSLRRQMYDTGQILEMPPNCRIQCLGAAEIGKDVAKIWVLLETLQARLLQLGIVIGVHIVEPQNVLAAGQQRFGRVITDEARNTRYKNGHLRSGLDDTTAAHADARHDVAGVNDELCHLPDALEINRIVIGDDENSVGALQIGIT